MHPDRIRAAAAPPRLDEVTNWLLGHLARTRPELRGALGADTALASLGMDSFDRAQLSIALEDHFALRADIGLMGDFSTVGELARYIHIATGA